mgnify:CR=1 FL=1
MALNSNQKLVTVKAYSRGEPIPLDESSVFETYALAETYASTNPTAYAGQLVTALSGTQYKTYVLQTNEEVDLHFQKLVRILLLNGKHSNN